MAGIFYGWWVLAATSIIHFWGAGAFYYSFTVFFNPIVDEFGWSYAATSFAASLRNVEGGIISPLIGAAADRWGARRILMLGTLMTGLGFYLFSRIDSLWSFYTFFVFISIGISLMVPIPGWAAVTNWFHRKRGLAMGILSGSIGLGGALVYLVNRLIGCYGWRNTLLILAFGTVFICLPCAFFVRHDPERYQMKPDGRETDTSTDSVCEEGASGFEKRYEYTAGQAARTSTFWLMTAAVTISGGILNAVMVHVMPYLLSVEVPRSSAALIAAVLVLVSTAGRFGLGFLTDRINSRYLFCFALAIQAIGLLILARLDHVSDALFFALCFGPGSGGLITLRVTMQADYFGRKAFGAIQGASMAAMMLGTTAGPILTGLFYDIHHTYRPVWLLMSGLLLACIPLALRLKPPRPPKAVQ
jgi:MFS transporter, OFA family, oxalate/formate antiporter